MTAEATYRDERGVEQRGPVVFWGEWEGPSRVVHQWPGKEPLPSFLQVPFMDAPPASGYRQNTDPWVFGDVFYYSNCKQRTNRGLTRTAMQDLALGSLILFGSSIEGEFVLDTVLVVGRIVGSFTAGQPDDLDVNDVFRVATIESVATAVAEGESFTLFAGASALDPAHGMFSFVPCLPSDGAGPRFPRPVIRLPGIINPLSKQAAAGAGRPRDIADVSDAWEQVVAQVQDQDLLLATRIELGVGSPAPPPAANPRRAIIAPR